MLLYYDALFTLKWSTAETPRTILECVCFNLLTIKIDIIEDHRKFEETLHVKEDVRRRYADENEVQD